MKHLLIIPALALTTCVPTEQTYGPTEVVQTCGPTKAVVISYTKDGLPIYDDQSPILPPCEASTHNQSEKPDAPVGIAQRPGDLPQPPDGKVKVNNGWGNGDQDAPGNSEHNNRAENKGGNHNGRNEAPANSWH